MSESRLSSNSQSSFNFYTHAFFSIFILAYAYPFFFFFHLRLLFLRDLRQMMKNEKFSLYSNILTALKIFIFQTINMLIFTSPYCSLLNLQQIYNIITQQYIRQIN